MTLLEYVPVRTSICLVWAWKRSSMLIIMNLWIITTEELTKFQNEHLKALEEDDLPREEAVIIL